jgi:hypothetical protein
MFVRFSQGPKINIEESYAGECSIVSCSCGRSISESLVQSLPDVMMLSIGSNPEIRQELRTVSSAQGRARTAAKLHKRLIEQNCKLAAVRTKDLYAHLSEGLDFAEAHRLAHFTSLIYDKLLEVYQTAPSVVHAAEEDSWATVAASSLAAWGIPKIDRLADMPEPLLLQFQEQHMISKYWRTLEFITTQINFSNALLLEQSLTPVEQMLLSPYFKFVKEQVALPWQRVYAAAVKHHNLFPLCGG